MADAFFNRGKRRVTLDLKRPDDLAAARRLAAAADVVIENFRPGTLTRLGLDLDAARRENPALITCSLPGFGAGDPRAAVRGYEGVIAAATANAAPRPGEEPPGWDWARPTYSALPLASSFAAYLGATAVVMALIARQRTGRGQRVEVPLFDAMFTLIGHAGAYANGTGLRPARPIHGRGAGAYRCKDGRYVQFDTSSPRHLSWFARAAGLLGRFDGELLDLSANARPAVNERLHAALRAEFLTRTAAEWEELGNAAGAAIGFIRTPAEWIGTEQARRTHAVTRVADPELGDIWCAGVPVGLSDFPDPRPRPRRPAGADTAEVLAELDGLPPRPQGAGPEPGLAQPLSGLRVLDLGLALAGPTCGRLLAEFGAEVVKIGSPGYRAAGYLNRGKDSLLLDLAALGGQEVYWRLVEHADVVLENFSPGTASRLAIGYDEVRARRPETVYTAISCYGLGGPWTGWRGWERQGQAVTGIMERTELPSVLGPYNIVDIGTGIFGAFATGLALYHRFTTGRGQLASASLAQTATYHQAAFMFDFPGYQAAEPRGYYALGAGPLQRYYRAADTWFFLAARADDRPALAALTGPPDSAAGPGPAGEPAGQPVGEPAREPAGLEAALEAAFATAGAADLVARLTEEGIAAHVVVPITELMTDAVVQERGLSVIQDVAGAGKCTMPGVSPRLSDTPALVGRPPSRPGADAERVLASVGLADRLDALERSWVIRSSADPPPAWP